MSDTRPAEERARGLADGYRELARSGRAPELAKFLNAQSLEVRPHLERLLSEAPPSASRAAGASSAALRGISASKAAQEPGPSAAPGDAAAASSAAAAPGAAAGASAPLGAQHARAPLGAQQEWNQHRGRPAAPKSSLSGAVASGGPSPSAALGLSAGRVLGDFKLVSELGRGGMGVVWEADQLSLTRPVALKVLYPHLMSSSTIVERFQREAVAAGRIAHAGVVQVYSLGAAEGLHFIALELVRGGHTLGDTLNDLRKARELPDGYYRGVAELFARIADALAAAHEAGVIHRDLKPSNILIAEDDHPKVADFGLAQVGDLAGLSRTGDVAGTPHYMSPEQASSKRMGLDHRTDVFSLGATFYEALTLVRPFDGDTSQQVFAKILTIDPDDPCRVRSRVPRELALICMKALEKSPEKRYASMREFGADLRRYLEGEPVRAKPPNPFETAYKWSKRHPTASATIGLSLVGLVVISFLLANVLATSSELARSLAEQERLTQLADSERRSALDSAAREEERRVEAEREAYFGNVRAATQAYEDARVADTRAYLDGCPSALRGFEWRFLDGRLDASLARFPHGNRIGRGLAFVGSEARLALVASGVPMRIYDAEHPEREPEVFDDGGASDIVPAPSGPAFLLNSGVTRMRVCGADPRVPIALERSQGMSAASWSPDGALVVGSVGAKVERLGEKALRQLCVWDARSGARIGELGAPAESVASVSAFSPDGARVAVGTIDGHIDEYPLVGGPPTLSLELPQGALALLAYSHDGQRLLGLSEAGWIGLWRVASPAERAFALLRYGWAGLWKAPAPELLEKRRVHRSSVQSARLSPREDQLAFATPESVVRLMRFSDRLEEGALLAGHRGNVRALEFRPDGRQLATGSADRCVRLWDAASGAEQGVLRGHSGSVEALSYSRDGRLLASSADDGQTRVWDTADTGINASYVRGPLAEDGAELGPPGGPCASAYGDDDVLLWQPWLGQLRCATRLGRAKIARFSADGAHLALLRSTRRLSIVSTDDGHVEREFRTRDSEPRRLCWLGAQRLAVLTYDRRLALFELAASQPVAEREASSRQLLELAATPAGDALLGIDSDGRVRVFSGLDLGVLHECRLPSTSSGAPCISPDGRRAFLPCQDGRLRSLELATGALRECAGSNAPVSALALSPDGATLVAGDEQGGLWSAPADLGTPARAFGRHDARVGALCFLPDGSRLWSAGADRTLRLFDARYWRSLMVLAHELPGVSALQADARGLRASGGHALAAWVVDAADASELRAQRAAVARASAEANSLLMREGSLSSAMDAVAARAELAPAARAALATSLLLRPSIDLDELLRVAWSAACKRDASAEQRAEALRNARLAVELAPGRPATHLALGACLVRAGEREAGNRELDSGLKNVLLLTAEASALRKARLVIALTLLEDARVEAARALLRQVESFSVQEIDAGERALRAEVRDALAARESAAH